MGILDSRWFRRVRSISLGFILGVVALELLLRVVGFAISMADDDHRATATAGERRVLCLGACYTIGLGTAPEDSYPAQLQDLLAQRYPQDPVAVINGGVRGKSLDYFARHIDALLDETQPRILVLNINDRLRFEAEELQRLDQGPVMSALHWLKEYSVLARVVALAWEGPPEDSGLPETWWEASHGEVQDGLSAEIEELESAVGSSPDDLQLLNELAHAYARRSDYGRSIETLNQLIERDPAEPRHLLRRAEYRVMDRDFEGAWEDLTRLPAEFPAFHDPHWEWARAIDPGQGWVHLNQRLALYYATWGKPGRAIEMVEEVQRLRPGTAWSHDYLDFLVAVESAQGSGTGLDASAPTADILFERMAGSDVESVARYGLFERNGTGVSRTEAEAAEAFELLLREHLEKVKEATEARGVSLIIENMSTRPEQSRIIAEVCSEMGIPLVQLQEGLMDHPQRDALLHPSQSLRLSAQGNAFMAEHIYPAVESALEAQD